VLAADLIGQGAKMINEKYLDSLVQRGLELCKQNTKWNPACKGCCVIPIYKVPGIVTGEPSYKGGNGYVVGKSCKQVIAGHKTDLKVVPYYGNRFDPDFMVNLLRRIGSLQEAPFQTKLKKLCTLTDGNPDDQ
jgi:hypothetical protein